MTDIAWTTEKRRIGDLTLYLKNPRKLDEKAKIELTDSLDRFDLVEIPAINKDNTIIAGNQRVTLLLEKHGPNYEIDARVPNRQLTEKECKEYLLRSNKNVGDWDFNTLLESFDNDILLDVGFTTEDLQENIEKVKEEITDLDFSVQGMDLSGFESYDYILLMFENTSDFVYACEKLGIKKMQYKLDKGVKKTGLGRAIYGKRIIDRITE